MEQLAAVCKRACPELLVALDFASFSGMLRANLFARVLSLRLQTLRLLQHFPLPEFVSKTAGDSLLFSGPCSAIEEMLDVFDTDATLGTEKVVSKAIRRLSSMLSSGVLPSSIAALVVPFFLGILRVKFQFFWEASQKAISSALVSHPDSSWATLLTVFDEVTAASSIIAADTEMCDDEIIEPDADPQAVINYQCTDSLTMHELLLSCVANTGNRLSCERSAPFVKRFLAFMNEQQAIVLLPKSSRPVRSCFISPCWHSD
jgi:hypothetical protein